MRYSLRTGMTYWLQSDGINRGISPRPQIGFGGVTLKSRACHRWHVSAVIHEGQEGVAGPIAIGKVGVAKEIENAADN